MTEERHIIDGEAKEETVGHDALPDNREIQEKAVITTPQSLTPALTRGFEIQMAERKRGIEEFNKFVKEELIEGQDYGMVPGVKKPFLWKGGAEKIGSYRALFPHYTVIEKTRDFENGFFDYWTKCTLYKVVFFDGKAIEVQMGEGEGTCNSNESKYRFRWEFRSNVPEDADIKSLPTKIVKGKDGKTYTMYKIVNTDPCSLDNTIRKMSNKRAYVAAVLTSTPGASIIFTQDMDENGKQKKKKESKTVTEQKATGTESGPGKPIDQVPPPGDAELKGDVSERPKLNEKLIHLKDRVGDEEYKEAINVLFNGKLKLSIEEIKILIKHLQKVDLDNMSKQNLGT